MVCSPRHRASHSGSSRPWLVDDGYESQCRCQMPQTNRRMMTSTTNLTCSLINVVSPVSPLSSHFPRNSSPRKGLRGFFSLPSFSLRLQYCWCSVLRNHRKTRRALFSGSGSVAGATKRAGCSAQYAEYSTREVEERMKGGAVNDDRSPLKEAID